MLWAWGADFELGLFFIVALNWQLPRGAVMIMHNLCMFINLILRDCYKWTAIFLFKSFFHFFKDSRHQSTVYVLKFRKVLLTLKRNNSSKKVANKVYWRLLFCVLVVSHFPSNSWSSFSYSYVALGVLCRFLKKKKNSHYIIKFARRLWILVKDLNEFKLYLTVVS